ncbi:MAG: hypothetical protein NW216_04790 [Hyphomicrobium sp.]|nr:hypothetical protein [Hyphomicrobium sp.]
MTSASSAPLVCAASPACADPRFTVGTLVNDRAQYTAMRASFEAGGFDVAETEYLLVDNTGPTQTCAYRGLNAVLAAARAPIVILCHQDVRLLADDRETLEARLATLNAHDPNWALCGNAGGVAPGELALRITDAHGADQNTGRYPARVMSLDENFIVVKRAARIGFSADLTGFHFYGADLCLNADIAGYRSYVIDFHLLHLSGGTKSRAFFEAQENFRAKWNAALRGRWMQTTCALVHISGSAIGAHALRHAERPYAKVLRRFGRHASRGSTP